MATLDRRSFLARAGLAHAGVACCGLAPLAAFAGESEGKVKPVTGSWFEFQHHATVEGVDWNPALVRFTAEQWAEKVREIAEAGLKYLVLMSTAVYYRTFFTSKIYPRWKLACDDPIEAVLTAADRYGVRFFIGSGFYGDWMSPTTILDPVAGKQRLQAMNELAERYGHHRSFYGWYWPDEAQLHPYFAMEFLPYVNAMSREARRLKPAAPIMIAPYGTRIAKGGDVLVRQLDAMDVDVVAYQDEVGVRKSNPSETAAFYERLRKAHDQAARARMWADVEVFEFEGAAYKSALVPASFDRVRQQMEAVSPYVDEILIYQYLGLMNKPGSQAFAGAPASERLYLDYMHWKQTRATGRG